MSSESLGGGETYRQNIRGFDAHVQKLNAVIEMLMASIQGFTAVWKNSVAGMGPALQLPGEHMLVELRCSHRECEVWADVGTTPP